MIPSTLSSPTAVTSGMDTMTLRFIMAMMMLMVKTVIMNWGLHLKFWLSLEDNRPLWWKGVVRPRDLQAALGRGSGSADGSACGSSFYQAPSLSFGQLLFKMTPQRHYFLVDGASKEIFFCSRDSVSMFTNKVKKDGDYDEVKNLISPVWNLKISKLFALG